MYIKDAVASPCHMFLLLHRIAMQYLFRNIAWSALAGRKRHIRTVVCHRPSRFQRHPLKTLSLINWSCEAVSTIQCSVARCLIKESPWKKVPLFWLYNWCTAKLISSWAVRELGDLIWQKMTTDDIISWSQSALFPPGATLRWRTKLSLRQENWWHRTTRAGRTERYLWSGIEQRGSSKSFDQSPVTDVVRIWWKH